MALTISKLKMWKDPGYTRNCPEMPPLGSWKLPSVPDYASPADETLRPHKDSTLTRLNLPLSFTTVFGMSYLYIEASDGAGSVKLFGWITSIEQRSTSAEGVTIIWDVDWWRSYSGSATLGAGQVVKCGNSSYARPYRTQPRYWKTTSMKMISGPGRGGALGDSQNALWLYILCVWTKIASPNTVTTIRTLFCPVNGEFYVNGVLSPYDGIPLDYVFEGKLDEFMDAIGGSSVTPKIIGVWVAPLCPNVFTWNSGTSEWSTASNFTVYTHDTYTLMVNPSGANLQITEDSLPLVSATTDATHRVLLTDPDGNICGELPYGLTTNGVRVVVDIGTNGGYMNVYFKCSQVEDPLYTSAYIHNKAAVSAGVGFSIPLLRLPVTENQWSDYNVTGQRDYDVTSARIANEQRAIMGLESSATSAIGGGVTGASAGPVGAAAGVIGGGAVSAIMTGINYGLGENFNQQLQEAKDKLYANQRNGIILTGGSQNKVEYNKAWGPLIIVQEADTVSAAEYSADITQNGYDTDIPVANVGTFISGTTGPYRILNLTITGNIPPQAKQYIKDKFETGVRIVENNPSGVAP